MITSDKQKSPQHRERRARMFPLGIAAAGTLIAGGFLASPALAVDLTVSTSAELIQAIEDANSTPGIDVITIDGVIVLEADLPHVIDGLIIQGRNGATIDGDAGAYRGILAEAIDHLSIEGVDFHALRDTAIEATDVQKLVVFSVGVENVTGHGLSVYANGTRVEIADVDVRESRYDGLRLRLFNRAHADVRDVSVRDSGRVEVAQPARERGGLSVQAMHHSSAELTRIEYLESTDERDRGDGSRGFAGIVVNGSENTRVTVSEATITGPIDIALQVTGADASEIGVEELSVEGVPRRTDSAIDAQTSDTAQVSVKDFRAIDSGMLLAGLADSSQVRLSHGLLEGSGVETAVSINDYGTSAPNSRFEAHELTVRNAPWTGMWIDGLADVDLSSLTLSHNGTLQAGAALMLMGNDTVRLTNSTVSDNEGPGVAVRGSGVPQQVQISSTTMADNNAEQFVVVKNPGDQTPSVHLRNSIVSGTPELEFEGVITGLERDHSGVTSAFSLWNGLSADFASHVESTGSGNIVNQDPQLGALADNGGFTMTRVPASGSPVIDAGDPDATDTPIFDQRGAARIDGVIDMGSVEAGTLGDDGPGDDGPGDGAPGDGAPNDGAPGDGGPGEGGPGAAGPGEAAPADGRQSLPATGGSPSTGLLVAGGVAAAAGLALLGLTRLRRQSS